MIAILQAAALPVRDGRVCLVTSRSRRRWVIPKGWIDPGHTPTEAALAEAWEEAGVVGALDPEPIGTYQYDKYGREYAVTVYVLHVTEEKSVWPERGERTRVWLPPAEAADRVDEPELRQIILKLLPVTDPFAPDSWSGHSVTGHPVTE